MFTIINHLRETALRLRWLHTRTQAEAISQPITARPSRQELLGIFLSYMTSTHYRYLFDICCRQGYMVLLLCIRYTQNAKHRHTESSAYHQSTTEFFAATAASPFTLRSTHDWLVEFSHPYKKSSPWSQSRNPFGNKRKTPLVAPTSIDVLGKSCRLTSTLYRPGMRYFCSISETHSAQLVRVTSWTTSH